MSVNDSFEKELEEYMKRTEPFDLSERKSMGLAEQVIALIVSICALVIAIAVLVIE